MKRKCKRGEVVAACVEGRGAFPFDMLRYDSCWPSAMVDVLALDGAAGEFRAVILHRNARDRNEPGWTPERWQSFGWKLEELP